MPASHTPPTRRPFVYIGVLLSLAGMARPSFGQTEAPAAYSPSRAEQIATGRRYAGQIADEYVLLGGYPLRRVQHVGQRLLRALPAPQRAAWRYRFHVIKRDSVLNAFALPGGNVYIFTGLLHLLHSDNDLAAVLGHELTHVRQEHWAREMAGFRARRARYKNALLSIHAGGEGWQLASDVINAVVGLGYSRDQEDAADEGGLENMVAAGYNPDGMVALFQKLGRLSHEGSMPAYMNNHPESQERIQNTLTRIAILRLQHRR